jgi:hypothetical protein
VEAKHRKACGSKKLESKLALGVNKTGFRQAACFNLAGSKVKAILVQYKPNFGLFRNVKPKPEPMKVAPVKGYRSLKALPPTCIFNT